MGEKEGEAFDAEPCWDACCFCRWQDALQQQQQQQHMRLAIGIFRFHWGGPDDCQVKQPMRWWLDGYGQVYQVFQPTCTLASALTTAVAATPTVVCLYLNRVHHQLIA